VAKYTAAGTYSVTLTPGKYHVTVVGAGGGASTAGFKTGTTTTGISGNWCYGTGGGGGLVYGDVNITETVTASVTVGAGSDGSAMTAVYDEVTYANAYCTEGGSSSFSFGNNVASAYGGNYGGYSRANMSTIGDMTVYPGGGGNPGSAITGFSYYSGNEGSIPLAKLTEFDDGESGLFDGGAAGGGHVPTELGNAGKGGDVAWGYADGVLVFNGGDGHDGAVLIERIG